MSAFISEQGAFNAGLPILSVDTSSPDKHGIAFERSENDLLARADELPLPSVSVFSR